MAWEGYYTLDGSEIINVARTEAYADHLNWFRPVYENADLATLLDQTYVDPVTDLAPWYDPDEPASGRFYGLYPISVDGVEDSSRTSEVVESTKDGGTPGRVRHGTKSVVFNGLLLGEDEAAVEYGMRWLRRALLGDKCSTTLASDQSLGSDLLYLMSEPHIDVDHPASTAADLTNRQRMLRKFAVNSGPTINARRSELSCAGAYWAVQFTGVAGVPFEQSVERPIIQGYMDPAVTDPWVPGVTAGVADSAPTTWAEVVCGVDTWQPIYDPLCPALIRPPAPVDVPLGCFTPPESWSRRKITVPAANVPLWGEVRPIVTAWADADTRNVRIRFYEDPDGTADPADAPCSFVGDVVFSYIPAGGRLIFDAAQEEVFVITVTGHKRRADSLVFTTAGKPVDWPSLSCGYGHILTIDTPVGTTPPVVDVALVARAV